MSNKQLTRSFADRWIGGVAAGLANYFGIEPIIARAIWALALLLTGGTALVFYFVMWFIMPVDDSLDATVNGFDPEEIVIEDVS